MKLAGSVQKLSQPVFAKGLKLWAVSFIEERSREDTAVSAQQS
jgi:hypothetical protein